MQIKPIGKNVLIAENKKTNTTSSGIIIEGVGTHESKSATVMEIGDEVTKVSVGDVIFPEWTNGNLIRVGENQRVIIKEEAILAIVK